MVSAEVRVVVAYIAVVCMVTITLGSCPEEGTATKSGVIAAVVVASITR